MNPYRKLSVKIMIKVIFLPRKTPSPHHPVEYYVGTDNYKTAEDVARASLVRDISSHSCYDQVVLTQISVIGVKQ